MSSLPDAGYGSELACRSLPRHLDHDDLCGKFKKLTPTRYILAVLFILKYIFI